MKIKVPDVPIEQHEPLEKLIGYVRHLLDAQSLTQQDLAELMGCKQSEINRVLTIKGIRNRLYSMIKVLKENEVEI